MLAKLPKKVEWKSVGVGMVIGAMGLLLFASLIPTPAGVNNKNSRNGTECVLPADEACLNFYDCDFGHGSLGNLRCYCGNQTGWKNFDYSDFTEVIENGR